MSHSKLVAAYDGCRQYQNCKPEPTGAKSEVIVGNHTEYADVFRIVAGTAYHDTPLKMFRRLHQWDLMVEFPGIPLCKVTEFPVDTPSKLIKAKVLQFLQYGFRCLQVEGGYVIESNRSTGEAA